VSKDITVTEVATIAFIAASILARSSSSWCIVLIGIFGWCCYVERFGEE
jgi:hypothetical protein